MDKAMVDVQYSAFIWYRCASVVQYTAGASLVKARIPNGCPRLSTIGTADSIVGRKVLWKFSGPMVWAGQPCSAIFHMLKSLVHCFPVLGHYTLFPSPKRHFHADKLQRICAEWMPFIHMIQLYSLINNRNRYWDKRLRILKRQQKLNHLWLFLKLNGNKLIYFLHK